MGCGTSKPGLAYEEKLMLWRSLGGGDLERVLESVAVALLDAQWVISHAEAGGVLTNRQALPKEAFLSLADLVEATTGGGLLPVGALSYPWAWLTKDHPDPRGANLARVARALKAMRTTNYGRITRRSACFGTSARYTSTLTPPTASCAPRSRTRSSSRGWAASARSTPTRRLGCCG